MEELDSALSLRVILDFTGLKNVRTSLLLNSLFIQKWKAQGMDMGDLSALCVPLCLVDALGFSASYFPPQLSKKDSS